MEGEKAKYLMYFGGILYLLGAYYARVEFFRDPEFMIRFMGKIVAGALMTAGGVLVGSGMNRVDMERVEIGFLLGIIGFILGLFSTFFGLILSIAKDILAGWIPTGVFIETFTYSAESNFIEVIGLLMALLGLAGARKLFISPELAWT